MNSSDKHHMRHALNMARQGLGRVGNARPSVGCVIVKDDHIIAAARTGGGGAPHAEAAAIAQAGQGARGATAYVTLEPCAHQGKTPPCADALITAGIKRVVIAHPDPFPQVNGQGIAKLKQAGIEVECGLLKSEAAEILKGFLLTVTQSRPLVTLKCATSLDGKIALENGDSQWITGDLARRYGHLERATHDAILVGVDTVLADDPQLTTRLGGTSHNPTRIILDTNLKTSLDSALVKTAGDTPVWILHNSKSDTTAFENAGIILHQIDTHDIKAVLKLLAAQGITRLLVEGGANVMTSFLKSGLYDRLLSFRAPKIIGTEGQNAVTALDIQSMQDTYSLKRTQTRQLGEDILEIFEPCSQD